MRRQQKRNVEREYFVGVAGRCMPPTKRHRPAVWECMLGAVYALDDEGKCLYFDYDYAAALKFAGVDDDPVLDLRIYRVGPPRWELGWVRSGCDYANPRRGKMVLWRKKAEKTP